MKPGLNATAPPADMKPDFAILQKTLHSPEFKQHYIENLISIADKNRVSVPLHFNTIQKQLFQELTGRDIVLKSRQVGVTSLIMALFLVDCITTPNTTSVVIAHEDFITQRLLAKAKAFEASIAPGMKPEMHHKSAYELSWEDMHSTFYIGSARSFVFGRGERIDNALCSEVAYWTDPEWILVPLGETIPITGRLILESTPNGEENYFHEKWQEATEGKVSGKSIFTSHFFPWWLCGEYQLAADDPESLPVDRVTPLELTADEERLCRLHQLSEPQIRWRRRKQSELGELFYQEYPEDEVSCFLPVRETVFDLELLNEKTRSCFPHTSSYQGAEIWHHPEPDAIYIIGADPSVGRVDKAAATVWNLKGLVHCATLTGLYEPWVFAEKLDALGRYYNNACLAIEFNNPGITVLDRLLGHYPNIYYQQDLLSGKITDKPGWYTDKRTKSWMVQKFKELLPDLITFDINLVREARNLRYIGGTYSSLGEDDLLVSAMVALACMAGMPSSKRGLVGVAGWKW